MDSLAAHFHHRLMAYAHFRGQVNAIAYLLERDWFDRSRALADLAAADAELTAALTATDVEDTETAA